MRSFINLVFTLILAQTTYGAPVFGGSPTLGHAPIAAPGAPLIGGPIPPGQAPIAVPGAPHGSGPHFVIYGNKFGGAAGPPPVAQLHGYNVYALSFLQTNGAQDKVRELPVRFISRSIS